MQIFKTPLGKEGLTSYGIDTYTKKRGQDVYDKYYASQYDTVQHNNERMKCEINAIQKYQTEGSKTESLLDIGSGTGHLINELKTTMKCIGIDKSEHMVLRAKFKYPDNTYVKKNMLDSMIFYPNQFTHVSCTYFTIYYIKNKYLLFQNCHKWLVPKGYLFIHMVDKTQFMKDGGDFKTPKSFKRYTYKSEFSKETEDDEQYQFKETFTDKKTSNQRINEHKLYMNTQREILSLAKQAKFDLVEVIDMKKCDYEYNYIYVLQKT